MERVASCTMLKCVELGVFDALEEGPRTARALAERFGFRENATESMLEMLAEHGLLGRSDAGYANSPETSEFLVSSSPFFQGGFLGLHARFNDSVEAGFEDLLRGRTDPRQDVDGDWSVDAMMDGMAQHARMGYLQDTAAFVAGLPGFADMRALCDIGGNNGGFSMALLDANPDLRGEILDLPQVAAAASRRIAEAGYADRLTATACDLRVDALPVGAYDLVLASHVLYAFVDRMAETLRGVHDSLRPGGWFVAQHANPDGGLPARQVSILEFVTRMSGYATHHLRGDWLAGLLREAGFVEVRTAPTGARDAGLAVAARRV